MTDHASDGLDRPVWHALTGAQAALGSVSGGVGRFDPAVSPFAVMADDSAEQIERLAGRVAPGEKVLFIQADAPQLSCRFEIASRREGVQLAFAAEAAPPAEDIGIVPLGAADAPEMLVLATLTEPGPFALRTHEMGRFWGVKHDGALVAMAGERLRVGGWTELSAVCTHPDHRGRGLAAALSLTVIAGMLARGERPFLHSYADNDAAIRLYEALGFRFARTVEALAAVRL